MGSVPYPIDRLKTLMARQGGVFIFGPNYIESTMGLSSYTAGKAVFSCAKIDDLEIPDALMIDGALIFCHNLTWCKGRKVTSEELKKWTAQLLDGIRLKPGCRCCRGPRQCSGLVCHLNAPLARRGTYSPAVGPHACAVRKGELLAACVIIAANC